MATVLHAGVVVAGLAGSGCAVKGSRAAHQWNQGCCVSASVWQAGASRSAGAAAAVRRNWQQKQRAAVVVKASAEGFETGVETKTVTNDGDVLPNHEWPENFSLLNFEDLISHYEPALFKTEAQPGAYLADIMSKTLFTAFPHQSLTEVVHFFNEVTGFPVVDEDYKVIGVISKKDRARASAGEDPKLSEIMSSPAITLSADKTVKDAAALMLKNKIHRIPIVNSSLQVVGIVTRTDIFTALDGEPTLS